MTEDMKAGQRIVFLLKEAASKKMRNFFAAAERAVKKGDTHADAQHLRVQGVEWRRTRDYIKWLDSLDQGERAPFVDAKGSLARLPSRVRPLTGLAAIYVALFGPESKDFLTVASGRVRIDDWWLHVATGTGLTRSEIDLLGRWGNMRGLITDGRMDLRLLSLLRSAQPWGISAERLKKAQEV